MVMGRGLLPEWTPRGLAGPARVALGRRPYLLDHDEVVISKPRESGRMDRLIASTTRGRRGSPSLELVVGDRSLPGDEGAAEREQW